MGHPFLVATVITLIPKARSGNRSDSPARRRPSVLRSHGDSSRNAHPQEARASAGGAALMALALEPSGEGPYVEAVREWIELVTPRPVARPSLFLVR
jgi:hypothetical protein